jgi:hypothetical protein
MSNLVHCSDRDDHFFSQSAQVTPKKKKGGWLKNKKGPIAVTIEELPVEVEVL